MKIATPPRLIPLYHDLGLPACGVPPAVVRAAYRGWLAWCDADPHGRDERRWVERAFARLREAGAA